MARKGLDYYLGLEYTFEVLADPTGGYVVRHPDLPGAFTQVDSLSDLAAMVEEARRLWIETAYEQGLDIPEPSYISDDAFSGKFIVRIPKSLHKDLTHYAQQEGVSLNQYVGSLLSRAVGAIGGASQDPPTVADSVVGPKRLARAR